jgi:hypothetical protein
LSAKFIKETHNTPDNWQTGPSDGFCILDKIITHYIYTLRSTLVGHKRTWNGYWWLLVMVTIEGTYQYPGVTAGIHFLLQKRVCTSTWELARQAIG